MSSNKLVKRRLDFILKEEQKEKHSLNYHIRIHFSEEMKGSEIADMVQFAARQNNLNASFMSMLNSGYPASRTLIISQEKKGVMERLFSYSWVGSPWLMVSYAFPNSEKTSDIYFEIYKTDLDVGRVSAFLSSMYNISPKYNQKSVNDFLRSSL